ncbi:hypothetical protein E3N88_22600 [Mikania micrantha]|uniref:Uncharacterized protein n=1 Tax=Mikania micrantha TaxID=192012 RepID=A0A5N6NBZ8_9ASTR|nr:hypothetical protein E3N88_22600 [Mikania micrantha]
MMSFVVLRRLRKHSGDVSEMRCDLLDPSDVGALQHSWKSVNDETWWRLRVEVSALCVVRQAGFVGVSRTVAGKPRTQGYGFCCASS